MLQIGFHFISIWLGQLWWLMTYQQHSDQASQNVFGINWFRYCLNWEPHQNACRKTHGNTSKEYEANSIEWITSKWFVRAHRMGKGILGVPNLNLSNAFFFFSFSVRIFRLTAGTMHFLFSCFDDDCNSFEWIRFSSL